MPQGNSKNPTFLFRVLTECFVELYLKRKYNLDEEEFLYIGDDINDLEALNYVKYAITVPDAVNKVKAIKGIQITTSRGGNGAFREVVDSLID